MIEKIIYKNKLYAVVIPCDFHKPGVHFFTPNNFSQQLAHIHHPKKYKIPAHIHNPVNRSVSYTLETLLIRKGKIRIDFYTQKKQYFQSVILKTGDVILLARGGHGITMLEETDFIEIKQGPYTEDRDKIRFTGIIEADVKLKGTRNE